MSELPPAASSKPVTFALDEIVYVAEGRGLTRLDAKPFGDLSVALRGRGHLDLDSDAFRDPDADDLDRPTDAPEERGDLVGRADRGRQPDPLELAAREVPQPFQAHRELRAPLVRGELVVIPATFVLATSLPAPVIGMQSSDR